MKTQVNITNSGDNWNVWRFLAFLIKTALTVVLILALALAALHIAAADVYADPLHGTVRVFCNGTQQSVQPFRVAGSVKRIGKDGNNNTVYIPIDSFDVTTTTADGFTHYFDYSLGTVTGDQFWLHFIRPGVNNNDPFFRGEASFDDLSAGEYMIDDCTMPTFVPTPTQVPTQAPTATATFVPTPTSVPTANPSANPTPVPTTTGGDDETGDDDTGGNTETLYLPVVTNYGFGNGAQGQAQDSHQVGLMFTCDTSQGMGAEAVVTVYGYNPSATGAEGLPDYSATHTMTYTGDQMASNGHMMLTPAFNRQPSHIYWAMMSYPGSDGACFGEFDLCGHGAQHVSEGISRVTMTQIDRNTDGDGCLAIKQP